MSDIKLLDGEDEIELTYRAKIFIEDYIEQAAFQLFYKNMTKHLTYIEIQTQLFKEAQDILEQWIMKISPEHDGS